MYKMNFRYLLNLVLLGFITFCLSACSWFSTTPSKFVYKPAGIDIKYAAESGLNSYDERPHSVMMVIYQLNSINGFHQLATARSGAAKLLSATKFDTTVLGVDSKFIFPNESGEFKIDRLENTQWVGVIVGYYQGKAVNITKEFEVPKFDDAVLHVKIHLNDDSIEEVKIND